MINFKLLRGVDLMRGVGNNLVSLDLILQVYRSKDREKSLKYRYLSDPRRSSDSDCRSKMTNSLDS